MASLPSRHWQDLPWPAFRDLPAETVAILPVAAIEQHGPHLPVSVDATINAGILARALAILPPEMPALALPMQSVGCSVEHIRYPGTLTSTPETLIALWTEIGESVARAGVRKLIVLNSHGGQPQMVDIVCRRLRGRAGMFAVACQWWQLGRAPGLELSEEEARHGIHAGLVETALMRHLAPERVAMEKAANFRSAWIEKGRDASALGPEGGVGFGWEAQDLHRSGALGDAAAATAEAGALVLEHAAARLATLIGEVHRFDLAGWLRDGP